MADRGPDAVGLKDVAAKAGVSHALVTHYFGTIDNLVDAALEAHAAEQRSKLIERIVAHPEDGPRAWLSHYFEWINQPVTARLFGWALVSGRIDRDDFFSRRQRGAQRVADAVEARLARDGRAVTREDLDFAVLLVLAASHGYALGRNAFWASLGIDSPGKAEDSRFDERLSDIVEAIASGEIGKARKTTRKQERKAKNH